MRSLTILPCVLSLALVHWCARGSLINSASPK